VTYIPAALRCTVEERASFLCEYCKVPLIVSFRQPEVDHIISEKHGGTTEENNLALTCWRCNRHKGTVLGSLDPKTGKLTLLFNPRLQVWTDHFVFQELHITGLTAEGRTTAQLLQFNSPERLAELEIIVGIL